MCYGLGCVLAREGPLSSDYSRPYPRQRLPQPASNTLADHLLASPRLFISHFYSSMHVECHSRYGRTQLALASHLTSTVQLSYQYRSATHVKVHVSSLGYNKARHTRQI